MNPNKIALFLVPAIPVGAIGGILAMSGLGYWDTFGFVYAMFAFVYVVAYTQGSSDYRAFIEENRKKADVYATWTEKQKLDAIRDALLRFKPQKGSNENIKPENVDHPENEEAR